MPSWITKQATENGRLPLYTGGTLAALLLSWLGWMHKPVPSDGAILSSAQFLAQQGVHDAAEEQVLALIKRRPRHLKAWLLRGYIEAQEGRLEESHRSHLVAERLVGARADLRRDIRLFRADLLRRLERPEDAEVLLTSLESEAVDANSERLRGMQAWADERIEEALRRFESARALAPESSELATMVAKMNIILGRHDEAQRQLSALPEDAPVVWPAFEALARARWQSGEKRKAMVALESYVERDPRAKKRLAHSEFWGEQDNNRIQALIQ